MTRSLPRLLMLALLCAAILVGAAPWHVHAQAGPDATTSYALKLRAGPGQRYAVLTVFPPGTELALEARNEDASWLLGHTRDGAWRGWVSSLYLRYTPGFSAARLPFSAETVAAPAAAPDPAPADESAAAATANPALATVPIVPGISANAAAIYQHGQQLGNQPRGLTKVGECNSMSYAFLAPFGRGQYDLGPYGALQAAIDFFPADAFTHESVAARAGLTSQAVLDPAWADPNLCPAGLSLLECEYERARPSVALIMLGIQDVYFLSPAQYEASMRRVIDISIARGVIPVLTTIPILPGDYPERDANRLAFNLILVNLAGEYGVPLMNFWRATESVQHHGIGVDFVHLSERGDNWTAFNGEEQVYGFTMWNLVALQTLDQLRAVMN